MFDGPKPHVGGPILPPGVPTVLIGGMPAATVGSMCTCAGPPDTIVIHGEQDDVVLLADVFDWARPQNLPIIVFPGAGHFFHGRLVQLQQVLTGMWHRKPPAIPGA